jgi:hypothetical protein
MVGPFLLVREQNLLFFPNSLKDLRLLTQPVDQIEHLRIINILAEINSELRQQAARPKLPINDESSDAEIKEHMAQQVFLRALQPQGEQIRPFGIPEQRRPISVEHTGWVRNGKDAALNCLASRLIREVRRFVRVGSLGHLEKVSPLRGRQLQHLGYASQRRAGRPYFLPLFQPRIPGGTDPRQLSNFFAPKARCSSPSFADSFAIRWSGSRLSVLPQKLAERPLPHRRKYPRIFCTGITLLRVFQFSSPFREQNQIANHKLSDDNFDDLWSSRQFTEHCILEIILQGLSRFSCDYGDQPEP